MVHLFGAILNDVTISLRKAFCLVLPIQLRKIHFRTYNEGSLQVYGKIFLFNYKNFNKKEDNYVVICLYAQFLLNFQNKSIKNIHSYISG